MTSFCTHCKTTKPADQFNTATLRCGLRVPQSWCRQCKAEQLRQTRVKKAEDGRKFRAWRPPTGEQHHNAKLSDIACASILEKWEWSAPELAEFIGPHVGGISKSRIKQVWRGERS